MRNRKEKHYKLIKIDGEKHWNMYISVPLWTLKTEVIINPDTEELSLC